MIRTFGAISAAATLAWALGAPAMAQPSGPPTPNEQVGMHTGTTATNGSAVIVQDQNGTHPEGYPGMSVRNHASGDAGTTGEAGKTQRHHQRRHHSATSSNSR
jgi:hypothetical protein